jgi:hypothetical protein
MQVPAATSHFPARRSAADDVSDYLTTTVIEDKFLRYEHSYPLKLPRMPMISCCINIRCRRVGGVSWLDPTNIDILTSFQEFLMKISLLGLGMVCALSMGFALAAQADETSAQTSGATSTEQVAVQPSSPTETTQRSLDAFRANVNPVQIVPTTGPYDLSDQFVNSRGFPLGGYKEISFPQR